MGKNICYIENVGALGFEEDSMQIHTSLGEKMSPKELLHKYYHREPKLEDILLIHSHQVAQKALNICRAHPELKVDLHFIYEAALLHDIGIFRTHAPGIQCHGTAPYILHGLLGGEILRSEGLFRHARVAERHTGTGLTVSEIIKRNLPLPHRDFSPQTIEEQIICYADKFYSKSRLQEEKSPEQIINSLRRFGEDSVARFQLWLEKFS